VGDSPTLGNDEGESPSLQFKCMRTAKCVFRSSASRSLVFPLGIDYAAAGEDHTQITIWV
jgi:hypothetical protein